VLTNSEAISVKTWEISVTRVQWKRNKGIKSIL